MIRKFYDAYVDGCSQNYVVRTENKEAKIVIECECGTHMLKVQSDTDFYYNKDSTVQANQTYYFAMFSYGNAKRNLWQRLKIAFKFIRTDKMFDDQICLEPNEAVKLSEFIVSNLAKAPQPCTQQ